jgi:hypothetical protein
MKPANGIPPAFILHPSSFSFMSDRKPFLLRIDPAVLEELQKWADDDLRSLNGQIEWLLRRLLVERGRMKEGSGPEQRKGAKSAKKEQRAD